MKLKSFICFRQTPLKNVMTLCLQAGVKILELRARYRDVLYFADQDILNAVFGLAPWYLYELPCQWNFVVWQCREETWLGGDNPRTGRGKNNCPGAERFGVSVLHGNSMTFYYQDQLREDLFRHIFDYWSVRL